MIRNPNEIREGEKKIRILIAGYPGIGKSTLRLLRQDPQTDRLRRADRLHHAHFGRYRGLYHQGHFCQDERGVQNRGGQRKVCQ